MCILYYVPDQKKSNFPDQSSDKSICCLHIRHERPYSQNMILTAFNQVKEINTENKVFKASLIFFFFYLEMFRAFLQYCMCALGRLRSVCSSVQSNQGLLCPFKAALDYWLPTEWPATTDQTLFTFFDTCCNSMYRTV